MINENTNIFKKSVKRILQVDPNGKQVNFLDSRYYKRFDKYYPSITYVLSFFPKNKFFEQWIKDVGHNSDIIMEKAAREGTQVHQAIENYLNGETITWIDDYGNAKYSLLVWRMILKFHDFWTTMKPTLLESEIHLVSDKYQIAGTCDLVLEIDGETWLLDIKTSNSVHTSYDLQVSAYVKCWNENYDTKVDKAGILWLKSSKRGPSKGKIQGKGWEVITSKKSIDENFNLFLNVYELFKASNPDMEPIFNKYPTSIQLGDDIYDKDPDGHSEDSQ